MALFSRAHGKFFRLPSILRLLYCSFFMRFNLKWSLELIHINAKEKKKRELLQRLQNCLNLSRFFFFVYKSFERACHNAYNSKCIASASKRQIRRLCYWRTKRKMHELTSFQAERLKIVETSCYTLHIPLIIVEKCSISHYKKDLPNFWSLRVLSLSNTIG